MSSADIRYDIGDAHPLIGRWAPDLQLDTSTARPLLLDTTGTLADAAAGWSDRVDVIAVRSDLPAAAMLLRPDGYLAWASDSPDQDSLREALTRWFGVSRGS
ncbi:aromatic-ring hydroxylase C-terminal domain-containing protein [Saccharopolyspora sp. NPDC002376]